MRLNPYLTFDGRCEAAFRFYEQALGGRIAAMTTYADTPAAEHTPPAARGRIIHARLALGGTVTLPIQETFWARRFGMLTDRFGTPWMVDCEKPV